MTIEELIEALQKAEGPSRELDCLIAVAIDGFYEIPPKYEGAAVGYGYLADDRRIEPGQAPDMLVRPYTASVDAALNLFIRALPGWHWHIGSCPSEFLTHADQPFSAELMGPVTYAVIDREIGEEPVYDTAHASAASAPLALVLAILRAKQVQP